MTFNLALTDDTYSKGAEALAEMNDQKSKLTRIEEELDKIWQVSLPSIYYAKGQIGFGRG